MKGEWCYFKSYFSKQDCEKIIKDSSIIPYQDALIGTNSSPSINFEARRSKIKFINSEDWRFSNLFTDLWKMALRANNDFFNIHLSKLDFVQFAEYDSSYKGEYKAHHDVFWLNDDSFYHRKLTCVIQLSDPNDYEGGDLELIDTSTYPEQEDMRQQGTVIFFPSFFMHRANPVLKGTRYSVTAWFEGPKWC
jgi:PKHD-type hydroxylase